jgi:hypothetical protein
MAKVQREPANDADVMQTGESITAEQLDHASVEMLQDYTVFGLRCLVEQCRHWQAMAEIELERRKSEGNISSRVGGQGGGHP